MPLLTRFWRRQPTARIGFDDGTCAVEHYELGARSVLRLGYNVYGVGGHPDGSRVVGA